MNQSHMRPAERFYCGDMGASALQNSTCFNVHPSPKRQDWEQSPQPWPGADVGVHMVDCQPELMLLIFNRVYISKFFIFMTCAF
jgi:hypothetical protein